MVFYCVIYHSLSFPPVRDTLVVPSFLLLHTMLK